MGLKMGMQAIKNVSVIKNIKIREMVVKKYRIQQSKVKNPK
jgi:hypothetical protein